jgi:hypothetical protein
VQVFACLNLGAKFHMLNISPCALDLVARSRGLVRRPINQHLPAQNLSRAKAKADVTFTSSCNDRVATFGSKKA